MYRFFDKHGKKVLAIASALLMVAFLLPSAATSWMHGGYGGGSAGKLNGKAVDFGEVDQAHNALVSLERLVLKDPRSPIGWTSVGHAIFRGHYNELLQDRLTWYLLLREAEQSGAIPNDNQISQIVESGQLFLVDSSSPGEPLKLADVNPTVKDGYVGALRQAFAVAEGFARSQRAVKISEPLLNDELVSRLQQVRARMAMFSADDFTAQLPAPTDEELRVQFEAFAATAPGKADAKTNPFGFGYRIPDRIRLQYIAIPENEVELAVIKSKTPELWEEDARIFYANNKKKFEELPPIIPPATQPASTQPVTPPFEAIAEKVAHEMRKPLIEQKRRVIVNRISQVLSNDFQRASKNLTAKPEEIADSVVGSTKLGSFDYLLRIRDDIQRQFSVTISVVNDAELISQQALQGRGGLGSATLDESTPQSRGLSSGAAHIFSTLEPLLPKDRTNAAINPLYLYQPTKSLSGGDQTYIARVVQVEAAHSPLALAEVKDQVERDVRRKASFAKAIEAAEAAVKKAQQSGLGSIEKPVVVSSEWFGMPQEIQPGFTLPMPIPGLPKEWDSFSSQLVKPTFDLQRGLTSVQELPRRDVVKLQNAGKVFAVELFDAKTMISVREEPIARLQLTQMIGSGLVSENATAEWYGSKSVFKRVGYVPPAEDAKPDSKKPDAAPRPNSPFMPG